jgi:CheY-like chemotaxis protein
MEIGFGVPSSIPETSPPLPHLTVATENGRFLRFLQDMAAGAEWDLKIFLTGKEGLDSAIADPPKLFLADVFLEDMNGFDLNGKLRLHPQVNMVPMLLVAPGCASGEELSRRLDISRARFEAEKIDEEFLARQICNLMGAKEDNEAVFTRMQYSTFLQLAGEACHAASQPLTSVICNLELAMRQTEDEAVKTRIKTSYDGALKIMQTIQQIQRAKWTEGREYSFPVYLLPRNTEAETDETESQTAV